MITTPNLSAGPGEAQHTPEQVVRKLREADQLLADRAEAAEVCRHLEVSVAHVPALAGPLQGDAPRTTVSCCDQWTQNGSSVARPLRYNPYGKMRATTSAPNSAT